MWGAKVLASGAVRVEWDDEDETDRVKAGSDVRMPRRDHVPAAAEASNAQPEEEEEEAADAEKSCCAVCLSDRCVPERDLAS